MSELNGWLILLMVFVGFFLLLQLRLWVRVEYGEKGVLLRLGLGPFGSTVLPKKVKSQQDLEKAKRKKEKQAEKAQKRAGKAKKEVPKEEKKPEKKSLGGSLELLKELLPVGLQAASRFKRKLRIKLLILQITWGASDPADAAIAYGKAQGALAVLLQVLEGSFTVKKRKTSIDIDFDLEKPSVYGKAILSISLWQLLSVGLGAGGKTLGILLRQRRKKKQANTKQEKAVQTDGEA